MIDLNTIAPEIVLLILTFCGKAANSSQIVQDLREAWKQGPDPYQDGLQNIK